MVRTCQPPGKLGRTIYAFLPDADDIAELSIRDVRHTVRSPGKRMSYGQCLAQPVSEELICHRAGIQVIVGNST
jgi:hypothetical protein